MSRPLAPRRIVVCADDFGGSSRADRAILRLAELGAISAISVFADGDPADESMPVLRRLPPSIAIGLHVNLTEPLPGVAARALPLQLARAALAVGRPSTALGEELERQFTRFEQRVGRAPQFIDGHEHVHQLRHVRECLLAIAGRRYEARIAVRTTPPRVWRGAKAALIAVLGGRALARAVDHAGLATNLDFAGVYRFDIRVPYRERMARWLAGIADLGLIMCHPEQPLGERAASAREAEYEFLASPAWPRLLQRCGVALVPFGSPHCA